MTSAIITLIVGFAAGYGVVWAHTDNGVSDTNTLQYFRGAARIPLLGPVGFGGSYSWYSRKTQYTGFFEARRTQVEWRVFLDLAFSHQFGEPAEVRPPR